MDTDLRKVANELWKEFIPFQKAVVKALYRELKLSLNKHATHVNIKRHLNRNLWPDAEKELNAFKSCGILLKHRTNTVCLSRLGRELAIKAKEELEML